MARTEGSCPECWGIVAGKSTVYYVFPLDGHWCSSVVFRVPSRTNNAMLARILGVRFWSEYLTVDIKGCTFQEHFQESSQSPRSLLGFWFEVILFLFCCFVFVFLQVSVWKMGNDGQCFTLIQIWHHSLKCCIEISLSSGENTKLCFPFICESLKSVLVYPLWVVGPRTALATWLSWFFTGPGSQLFCGDKNPCTSRKL